MWIKLPIGSGEIEQILNLLQNKPPAMMMRLYKVNVSTLKLQLKGVKRS